MQGDQKGRDRGEIDRWVGFEVHPAIVNGAGCQTTKYCTCEHMGTAVDLNLRAGCKCHSFSNFVTLKRLLNGNSEDCLYLMFLS